MELNDSNRESGFPVAHGIMTELFSDPFEGFACEGSRGPELLRIPSTAPAGRTGYTAYRQSIVIRRVEQMDKDERRSHKRARGKSPEYLETGYSDRRCADRDSALERARENEPTLRHGEWHRRLRLNEESSRSWRRRGQAYDEPAHRRHEDVRHGSPFRRREKRDDI